MGVLSDLLGCEAGGLVKGAKVRVGGSLDPFVLIAGGLAAAGVIGSLQLWFSDRQWVGMWRGHRVSVHHVQGRVVVELDGESALSQVRLPLRWTHSEDWSHPALGHATVSLSKLMIGGNGEFTVSLAIGDERVPLVEVERQWLGVRALLGLRTTRPEAREQYWASLTHTAVEPLGDDRWVAACRLLDLTRQSQALTPDIRDAANNLQATLRRSFEARQRLGDEALDVLGAADADEVRAMQGVLEERIVSALEAVKSLHMAVISIESQADETRELGRVQSTLDALRADDEVERFMQKHAARKAREGLSDKP